MTEDTARELDRLRRKAFMLGAMGLLLFVGGTLVPGLVVGDLQSGLRRSFYSYLGAFVFWVGVPLGSMAIAMLHQMSGGVWGFVIRRFLESAMRTLPLMALLFLPLIPGLEFLYDWANAEAVQANPIILHKSPYLNAPFFLARTGLYFTAWLVLGRFFLKWSDQQDATGEPALQRKLQLLSGPGLVLYGLTVTFASIDWVMSLDVEWYSTIFGILFIGGQGLSALSVAIVGLFTFAALRPFIDVVRPSHFHDLGKLLLAFVMLWAYFHFSQFLVVWAGNLPEEIPWYLRRSQGPWKWFGLLLVVFHFAIPFFLLLSRSLKRRPARLVAVTAIVFFMRFVDMIWLVSPEFKGGSLLLGSVGVVMDFAALIGVGGIWTWVFLYHLQRRPLLALHDPNWENATV